MSRLHIMVVALSGITLLSGVSDQQNRITLRADGGTLTYSSSYTDANGTIKTVAASYPNKEGEYSGSIKITESGVAHVQNLSKEAAQQFYDELKSQFAQQERQQRRY